MDCLKGYIGLIDSVGTSVSGLYVSSLPGISLESVDKSANAEQSTYAGVWANVESRAVARFATDLRARLTKYKLNNPSTLVDLGKQIDVDSVTAHDTVLRGILINASTEDGYSDSVFKQIHVQSVNLYSTQAGLTINLKVYDAITGELLDTVPFATTVTGWNFLYVGKNYTSKSIIVAYDASTMDGVLFLVEPLYNTYPDQVYGVQTTASAPNDYEKGTNSFGLSAVFAVTCGYDALVCNFKTHFAIALQYLLGIELLVERRFSPRLNRWTLDKKTAEDLQIYYEGEYTKYMKDLTSTINISLLDGCIECNSQVTYRESRM